MSGTTTQSAYDEVPYPEACHCQTHPRRLATIAALFGLESADIHGARVLELGSAKGSNLIPMAVELPEATFVGVERSVRQFEQCRDRVSALELHNIDIRHADILDVSADLGIFDYIIVHGVYSWVPAQVRERILAICKENLSPQGVAYVSYNCLPGWHMRGMVRNMMLYHAEQFKDPEQRLQQSRALVQFLADSTPTSGNPYGLWLKQELESMSVWCDGFLYHGPIAEINEPFYFHQFMKRAEEHGLQFLGESEFSSMVASNFGTQVHETLSRIAKSVVATEQYMDFVRNRMFRQTLLCHEGIELQRVLSPQTVEQMSVCCQLDSNADNSDLNSTAPLDFELVRQKKHKITTAEPVVKAALWALSEQYPRAVPFAELLDRARRLLKPNGDLDTDATKIAAERRLLGETLLNLYVGRHIELVRYPYASTGELGVHPRTTALVRMLAAEGKSVANLRHETVALDAVTQQVVQHLDGHHDRESLVDKLVAKVDAGLLAVRDSTGQPVRDHERVGREMRKHLENALDVCVRGALLLK